MAKFEPYSIVAFNAAKLSENKMHDDTVAKKFGFTGGLVPGVDVYAYLCWGPVATWGRAWLEGGTMEARFRLPTYDGETVMFDVMGFGNAIGDLPILYQPGVLSIAWGTAIRQLAAGLGIEVDEIRDSVEQEPAPEIGRASCRERV